jgi:hypothetical protein
LKQLEKVRARAITAEDGAILPGSALAIRKGIREKGTVKEKGNGIILRGIQKDLEKGITDTSNMGGKRDSEKTDLKEVAKMEAKDIREKDIRERDIKEKDIRELVGRVARWATSRMSARGFRKCLGKKIRKGTLKVLKSVGSGI